MHRRPTVDQPLTCVQEEDDFMLRRFLRARDNNINKASAMFLKYLSWKRTAKPCGHITEAEVRGELVQDKLYVQGFDKTGRPMIYLFGNRHFAAKRDLEEFKRYVIYILDNTCTKYVKLNVQIILLVNNGLLTYMCSSGCRRGRRSSRRWWT